MKTLAILAVATGTFYLPLITAQGGCSECSCSPQTFVFQLNLLASCPALPPPFPPNDVFGAGVKDYTCSIGLESRYHQAVPPSNQLTKKTSTTLQNLESMT